MAGWLRRSRNIVQSCLNRHHACLSRTLSQTSTHALPTSTRLIIPVNCTKSQATIFSAQRFKSTLAENQVSDSDEENQTIDFPGGKISYTSQMQFIPESTDKRIPCYQVLDDCGIPNTDTDMEPLSKEMTIRIYKDMVTLQIMDTIFYEAQRQGRMSFYLTMIGEEAINIGSAAALTLDDCILAQYREPGVLLWRGFTVQDFANQLIGNNADHGKGRQMPVHYGSSKFNYFTISSPLTTQLPQAVGSAYSLKMDKKDACVVAYFGDGASSEGDFHAGMNFAAVMDAPVVFICRNNGWAISTPISEQFRSDGIAAKGQGYGIRSIRVDGNDALAVYNAVRVARKMAISENRPILIEVMTYRVSHHSTSDDSTKYRQSEEIEYWKTEKNPVSRLRKCLEFNGWWNNSEESDLRSSMRKQVSQALQAAEKMEKPSIAELFNDVYDHPPSNLIEQEKTLKETIKRHPQDYPHDVPIV